MLDLTTYALLHKQIASTVSGVRAEGEELIFVYADGREVRVAVPVPTFSVVDGMLRIDYEEEVTPT